MYILGPITGLYYGQKYTYQAFNLMTNLVVSDNKVFKYILNSSSFNLDLLIRCSI